MCPCSRSSMQSAVVMMQSWRCARRGHREGPGHGSGALARPGGGGSKRRQRQTFEQTFKDRYNSDSDDAVQDVVIVKGLVMGLVRSHGLAAAGYSSAGGEAAGQHRVLPAEALRPFLHEHSEQFWHELR